MAYDLCIADRAYSSWSLRGWLLFDAFGLVPRLVVARLYEPGFAETLKAFAPARTVPALRLPEGVVIGDSLAIAEELASRHPSLFEELMSYYRVDPREWQRVPGA